MKRLILLPLLIVLTLPLAGCALLPPVEDPIRTGLYVVKEQWVAVREYVIAEHIRGHISDEELAKFKAKDDKFTRLYNLSVTLYLGGADDVVLDQSLRELRNMMLEARKKYFPGGL